MALVEIRDVHKVFQRDSERIEIFTGLTLDIAEGSFTALMGPSGSGKSTLLNLLAGLDKPTSGTIRVAGAEVSAMTPGQLAAWRAQHIGFVFQNLNLLPVLTAYQNVELPLLLTRLSKKERDERVKLALGVVGLDDRLRALSRGSSPAARSSGSPSRAPSSPIRRWSCSTSRPASSTPRARRTCSGLLAAAQRRVQEDHHHRDPRRPRGRAGQDGAPPGEGRLLIERQAVATA